MNTVTSDSLSTASLEAPPPEYQSPSNNDDESPLIPLSKWRRRIVLLAVCWMVFPMNFASSSILAAAPEVASSFHVPTTSISIANAGVFLGMAASPLIWGPIENIMGRRASYITASVSLCLCSIGSALAPTMAVFTVIWILGGTTAVVCLTAGQTLISDCYKPTSRGRASGLFLSSSNSAQMIAPLVGGILATYTSWRVIYGVQASIAFVGAILSYFYIPYDVTPTVAEMSEKASEGGPRYFLSICNPFAILKVLRHPEIFLAGLSCGLLSFNHYALLSSIRYAINERFHLTTPQTSGLFYLAPGFGYICGSILGGMLSDRVVRMYIKKRNGVRLPRDRLNCGVFAMLIFLPLGTLLFGWSLDRKIGGMALPAVGAFTAAASLMTSFGGVNTFSVEARPSEKRQAINCKYIFQYVFAAASVSSRLPSMEAIGVGWSFTTTALSAILAGVVVLTVTRLSPKLEMIGVRGGRNFSPGHRARRS